MKSLILHLSEEGPALAWDFRAVIRAVGAVCNMATMDNTVMDRMQFPPLALQLMHAQ